MRGHMYLVLDLLSLLIIFVVGILCLMLFLRNNRNRSLIDFGYLLIVIDLWLISNYALKIFTGYSYTLFSLKTTFATAALILYFLYRFSENFPNIIEPKNRFFNTFSPLATGFIVVLSYSKYLVSGFTIKDSFILAKYESGFYLFLLYVIFMFGIVFYFFWNQYRVSSTIEKQQSKFLFIGLTLSMIFVSSIDLIIPVLSKNNISANYGPFGIIFIVAFALLALTKHHLFETKVIISEFWATLLVIMIFAWLVLHFSIGNLVGFLFILSICVLLIKSVISESGKENELEEANKRLERDKKKLVELDRMKDEFLQMATHELNTPITVIQGKLSMAIDENMCNLDEKQKEFLEPVLVDTKRLSNLSKDILDVARIDQHRLKINVAEADLDALIDSIVSDFKNEAKERGNSIEYIKSNEKLPRISFDQSKIGEVISNLLNNANKFTENGQITIKSIIREDRVIVSVSDTGIGIEKEAQDHLFEKFYQVGRFDSESPQEQQGSGLGLYISKNIIEIHGGKIWFESNKDRGSTFYFSLPLEYKENGRNNKKYKSNHKIRVL